MKSTRTLAWFAIAAQVIFVATWLVLGAIEENYSHVDHYISELGADGAANPNAMNVAIVVLGLAIGGLAVALHRVLPARPAARVSVALFALIAVGFVLAGLFNGDCSTALDPTCQERWDEGDFSTQAAIHAWAGFGGQVLVLGTPFALARALWNRHVAAPALATGIVGIGLAVVLQALYAIDEGPDGLVQRASFLFLHIWIIEVAIGVLWATRRPPEPPAATPLRPSEFFGAKKWEGEGELVPWPYFIWRRWPQRFRALRETTFVTDELWYFDDRAWLPDGTLIEERRLFCLLTEPDRVAVTADPLLDGTEILLEENGYRIVPYRVAIPVGPVHFGVTVRDSATIDAGMLVNSLRVSWFGLPVARIEVRARPDDRNLTG